MLREVDRCPCKHRACKDWHVSPEAAIQGVHFDMHQASAVARVLDFLDHQIDATELINSLIVVQMKRDMEPQAA